MSGALDPSPRSSAASAIETRIARVERWLSQIAVLQDPCHVLGSEARHALPPTTSLAPESVEWALTHALETHPSRNELRALVDNTVEAPTAHVLLSANVFVGALRAIAIALASSSHVCVRASRREPTMARLLNDAAPGTFHLVTELHAHAGDHLWAYGSDSTLAQLRAGLPKGVVLHAYGEGFGVVVIEQPGALNVDDFDALALDIAAFDQKGCLSPRFVLVEGDAEATGEFARCLMAAMNRAVEHLPLGDADAAALAAAARHRELWLCLGEVLDGPGGSVSIDVEGHAFGAPPVHRTVHVRATRDAMGELIALAPHLTAVSSRAGSAIAKRIGELIPTARWSPFGWMQRPALDGPVDRRADPRGVVL
jgi:hypothetical protein